MAGSLFALDNPSEGERFDVLARTRNVIVERIASSAVVDGKLYDQAQDEWVALLRGEATLEIEGKPHALTAGDHVFIPAHQPHRVTRCSADAIWLAVHVFDGPPP
ncbi:MAG: cupin domain-containing protein [Myxococcales bacterium]|nr:cupin domain-containing protein [Myxococcales bacterium]